MIPGPAREWVDFAREIHRRTGLDLAAYQPRQMQRRLRWLMLRSNVSRYGEYIGLLDRQPEKLRELREYVTINVSEFFRSPEQFERLRLEVLPRLLEERHKLRVWSAGCSYGAEAYSVAMLLADLDPTGSHTILATDVDEAMLARARAADAFSEDDVRNLPAGFRDRWFSAEPEHGRFSLAPEVSSRVTFRKHDLLADAFEKDFDLILCRNVMIYFTREAKVRVFKGLHDALRPGGVLFLGSAEALAVPSDTGLAHDRLAFYRKLGEAG